MVNSQLNPTINYIEKKDIARNDYDLESDIWNIEVGDNTEMYITIGNLNHSYADDDLVFINIYALQNGEISDKIGVFEFNKSEIPMLEKKITDDTLELEDLGEPLFFSYVDEDYLKQFSLDDESSPPGETVINEPEVETFNKEEQQVSVNNAVEQTQEESEEIQEVTEKSVPSQEPKSLREKEEELLRDNYQEEETGETNWLNKFFSSRSYDIIDNEGGGDCFFAVIRDAYKQIMEENKKLSIKKLRALLLKYITPELFDNYFVLFNSFNNERISLIKQIQEYEKENETLTSLFENEQNAEKQREYISRLENLQTILNGLQKEKEQNDELVNEYRFMKNVKNIEDFKRVVQTCEFWAETWAVSSMERALKTKIIVLSSENYDAGDVENVLLCGQENFEDQPIFEPKYYIMTEHSGQHYQLITYDNKKMFKFDELPTEIKKLIVNKCMEKQGGIYNTIPEFKRLKERMNEFREENMTKEEKQERKQIQDSDARQEKTKSDLYDENIVFQFYSKSKDAYPGKGSGEKVPAEDKNKFKKLNIIKDWRRKLSNFDVAPFVLDGKQWASVEHFYQANKFKQNHPEFYEMFSLDSETSEFNKNPLMAKNAGGKTGKYRGKQLRPKDVKVDEDFFTSGRNEEVMERGMMAKFNQDEASKDVLLKTKDAKLVHFSRGEPPITFNHLMRVRNNLRKM